MSFLSWTNIVVAPSKPDPIPLFARLGKCLEIWIYFPYFSSRFGFSFFSLWKKHLSPCKVTLLIFALRFVALLPLNVSQGLSIYPGLRRFRHVSLVQPLPPLSAACNLIYSCDAHFLRFDTLVLFWFAISSGVVSEYPSPKKRETPCRQRQSIYRTDCCCCLVATGQGGACNFLIAPCRGLQIHFEFGSVIAKSCKNFI